MDLAAFRACILEQGSSPARLRDSMEAYVRHCSRVTGIGPDPSFSAWAGDAMLADGVAINPGAAAQCALDYHRGVVFLRGVNDALETLCERFPGTTLQVLYAGCGPYATLLLPLLGAFHPQQLRVTLLDAHRTSLAGVNRLLSEFGLHEYAATTWEGDACDYRHGEGLHLVIAETMQKALEQEPQFAVTANLAPQLLAGGFFIPQRIEVALGLADLEYERALLAANGQADGYVLEDHAARQLIATVCELLPGQASAAMEAASPNPETGELELSLPSIEMPLSDKALPPDMALFTQVEVFGMHRLADYASEITLPLKVPELQGWRPGDRYRIRYQFGSYPRLCFEPAS